MQKMSGALLMIFLASCSTKQTDVSAQKKKAGEESSANQNAKTSVDANGISLPAPKNEDTLAIPTNIAGAHLTCAVRKEASDKSFESEIGCRLVDSATGTKIAPDPKLSFASSEPAKVKSEAQGESSIYHVLYKITGDSKDQVVQIAQNLDALIRYADLIIKTEKVMKVLKPAIELNDYEAPIVREQTIDKDNNGSL